MNSNLAISPGFSSAEAERLYYLQALGISTYYPRFILPGAAPSAACLLAGPGIAPEPVVEPKAAAEVAITLKQAEAPADTAHAASNKQPVHDVDTAALVSALAPLKSLNKKPESNKPESNKPESSKAAKLQEVAGDPVGQLQFQMLLVAAGKNMAVCNQIPYLAKGVLNNKEQLLLQNLLRWLGTAVQTHITPRRFTWPLPGLAAVSREVSGRAIAGKGLHNFMEQARQELGFSHLLLMGSNSIECLEEFQHSAPGSLPDWHLVTTHSLSEMLAFPELKKTVYQHLLPLHARLAEANS